MRKIIAIGESILDTVFHDGRPVRSFVGGRVSNAAALLGKMGHQVSMMSECGTDKVGDWVVSFFEQNGVDTKSIDRYTDGATPMAAIFEHEQGKSIVNYGKYPPDHERFNVIWPRIDENDIVLFGSHYAIDTPQRDRLYDILSFAADRKAILVYLPGFQHGKQFNITKAMPAILENIELASILIDHDHDINTLFPNQSSDKVYYNHVRFYGATYLHIAPAQEVKVYTRDNDVFSCPCQSYTTPDHLAWQAAFIAGVIHEIIARDITRAHIDSLTQPQWQELLTAAIAAAG